MILTVNVIMDGSYESGSTCSIIKKSSRSLHKISEKTKEVATIKDELEVSFSFKEGIDLLNLHHNAIVISLGITICLIKRISVDNASP